MEKYAYDNFYIYKAYWLDQHEGELLIQLLPEKMLKEVTTENSLTFVSGSWEEVRAKYPDNIDLIRECMDTLIHHQKVFTRSYQLVEINGILYFNPYFQCPLSMEKV